MLNKKGFTISFMVLLVCFVAFFVISILFYILFASFDATYMVGSDQKSSESHFMLLNYLRTPVEVNFNNLTMADLMVISVNNNNYDILTKKTQEILGNWENYYLVIVYDKSIYDKSKKGEQRYWIPNSLGMKVVMQSPPEIIPSSLTYSETTLPNYYENMPSLKVFLVQGPGTKPSKTDKIIEALGGTNP